MTSEYRRDDGRLESALGDGEKPATQMTAAASRHHEIEKLRRLYVDNALVANPRWDILLSLYVGKRDGAGVPMTSLAAANRIGEDNCDRFVEELVEAGLAGLAAPQSPGGSPVVVLSDRGTERMDAFLRSCGRD